MKGRAVEMPVCGRRGKPKAGFPPRPQPLEIATRFPHSHRPGWAWKSGKPKAGFPLSHLLSLLSNQTSERRPGGSRFAPPSGSFFNEKMLSRLRSDDLNLVCRAMHLTIDLPEDICVALQGRWGDVSRHALETLALEAYRTGALSEDQVKRLLGFDSRFQVHALLKRYQVPLRYTDLDLQDDLAAHRELGILNNQ